MNLNDFHIHSTDKLDRILVELCEIVIGGQHHNSNEYGMVAAAVLDPNNNLVTALNYLDDATDTRVHAERAAIDSYKNQYGQMPPAGSIIITTLSPCSDDTHDNRRGTDCTEMLNQTDIRKVYCGYQDPTQDNSENYRHKKFHVVVTRNSKIKELCKNFAKTFLGAEQLDELNFLGSPCTKDCSGHRAGYEWSFRKGGRVPSSWSQSFNNGAALQRAGK
jgi:pyrimidine deaminase RibD-like protein